MKRLLIILFVLCFQQMVQAQGWQKHFNDTNIESIETSVTKDSGFLILERSFSGELNKKILKLDKSGNIQWSHSINKSYYSFAITETSKGFTAVSKNDSTKRLNIFKFSKNGVLDTTIIGDTTTVFNFNKIQALDNDEFLLLGSYPVFSFDFYYSRAALRKISTEGKIQWENTFDPRDMTIKQLKIVNGKYYCLMYPNGISVINSNGQLEKFIIAPGYSSNFDIFSNSDYIYNCYLGLFLVNSLGYKKIFGDVLNVFLTKREQLKVVEYRFNDENYITILDSMGNMMSQKRVPYPTNIYSHRLYNTIATKDGGVLFVELVKKDSASTQTLFLMKLDSEGSLYPNDLYGKIIFDKNTNCKIDSVEQGLNNIIVLATWNDGQKFYSISDSLGKYYMNLDSGIYQIKALLPNNSLWQSCTPSVSKTFSSIKKTDTLDFLLSPAIDCPALETHITTPFLRRCFNNTYAVSYCNKGTTQADNAYLTVTLDSLLEFISASKSITSQVGRTYRFNLGNIAVDDCGRFDITTRVRCGDSTRLNQALCVEARIFPDTICTPNTLWSGANIVVTGTCQQDSVLFQIRNTGTAPSSSLNSIVIEDEVLFLRQPVQLPRNGVFSKKFPANGRTWRMVVEQEPNHPTSTNPTAFVEGCRANNNVPFNTGFVNLFPNDDKALTIDVDCHPIQGAYDPNDKTGYPLGYKSEHYVAQNQDIEYIIRFQNTGTDTAFNIVVRDTISEKLDISSIEFGSSSHIYEPEIYGKGILKFTFNNIQLVDSFKNEAKSHGFVQYRIKQQKDLAFGTKIYNSAGIYFDFNEPILTNKTLHTIGGKDIISATIEKNYAPNFPIKISPNPFTETAVFETPLSIVGDFELLDITGKVLRKEKFEGTAFEFHRNGLAAGIYLFKISVDGRPLSIGKLVIQ